jgi:hypothetical protein
MQEFVNVKKACLAMQSNFRGRQARLLHKSIRAARNIQRVYKGYRQLKIFNSQKRSAIMIQAIFRAFSQSQKYLVARDRLISLQAVYRGFSQQQQYKRERGNLIKLQAEWRRYSMEQTFKTKKAAAIKIQANFRAYVQAQKFQRTRAHVILSQAICRGFVARQFVARHRARAMSASLQIQSLWKGYKARKASKKAMRSIHVIQAHYRGWMERLRLWNACRALATKAREMRMRIEEARRQVQEHLKLGNKTKAGIEVLLMDPSISRSMKAVESLEIATRLSRECAQCITELGAVERLYKVISTCTRSLPEMKLAKACLQTLNNFSIYKEKFRLEISLMPISAVTLAEFIESKRDDDQEAVLLAIKLLRFICEDTFSAAEIAAIPRVDSSSTPFERLNRTIHMMEKKIPTKAAPLANNNGKPSAADKYCKCIKALKALTRTIGESK